MGHPLTTSLYRSSPCFGHAFNICSPLYTLFPPSPPVLSKLSLLPRLYLTCTTCLLQSSALTRLCKAPQASPLSLPSLGEIGMAHSAILPLPALPSLSLNFSQQNLLPIWSAQISYHFNTRPTQQHVGVRRFGCACTLE